MHKSKDTAQEHLCRPASITSSITGVLESLLIEGTSKAPLDLRSQVAKQQIDHSNIFTALPHGKKWKKILQ